MHKYIITLIYFVIFLLFITAYIFNIEPYTVGLNLDDGVYVSLAKALAEGKGYIDVYRIDQSSHACYFPFYPFLLSLIWRIYPYFPANILLFKLMSISAFFAFLIFSFLFLKRLLQKEVLAYSSMILLVSCVSVYQYSNCVNADIFYAAFQFLSLYLLHKIKNVKGYYPLYFLCIVISSALLIYIRPVGVTFCFAWLIYFLLKRKFKYLLAYGMVIFLITLPWLFHLLKNIESSYMGALVNRADRYFLSCNTILPIALKNLRFIVIDSIPMYVFPSIYSRFVVTNFASTNFILMRIALCLLISTLTVYGFICLFRKEAFIFCYTVCYFGLLLVWNWEPTRFLLPLAPFIVTSFLYGVFKFAEGITRFKLLHFEKYRLKFSYCVYLAVFFVILTGNLVRASDLFNHDNFSLIKKKPHPHQVAFDWIMNNTKKEDRIATMFDAMYYLYTSRKARTYNLEETDKVDTEQLKMILDSEGIYYIIKTHLFVYDSSKDIGYGIIDALKKDYPFLLKEVFRDSYNELVIYKVKQEK